MAVDLSKNTVSINKKISVTDVTAIAVYSDNILAGIANVLYVFNLKNNKSVTFIALKQFRIHGIKPNIKHNIVAIYGNREIAIASFDTEKLLFQLNSTLIINDWIWDIKWQQDNSMILILSANNIVTLWNWKTKEKVNQVICESKHLLYCGIILENTWNNTVLMCGSMFKNILIWAPSMHNKENICKILHKLDAHKGAIFSIYYNKVLQRMSSTSDDRSVKIWQIKFDCKYKSVDSWIHADFILIYTVYGHMSRVWKSVILDDGRFISAGEDSQLRIWDENGTAIYHWETHQGASLRCLSVNENQNIIITGSKNSGISIWPLNANYSMLSTRNKEIKFDDNFCIFRIQDVPKRLVLSNLGQLLTITNQGMFFIYNDKTWKTLFTDSRYSSYCLFETCLARNFFSLSSINGHIVILNECSDYSIIKICDEKLCSGRIYSFHWLSSNKFITCTTDGQLEVWTLIYNEKYNSYFIKKESNFILPLCKERWLTSAIQFNSFLLVGDREGSIHLFHSESAPLQTFRKIHGRLGVSFIWRNGNEIYSIGRDGFIRYWNTTNNGICYTAAEKLPVKWPTRVVQSYCGLLVLGFNETNFEVWNVKNKKQLLTYTCGGGHRPWDFSITNQIVFVYIRERVICNLIIPINQLLKPSYLDDFHIRDVNCSLYLSNDLIISGSEDTTLRLSKINFKKSSFSFISVIRNHISSIKTIRFLRLVDCYLVFSAGGRAQLKVWKFFVIEDKMIKYEKLASHMLKSQNKHQKSLKNVIYNIDLEPRHMDLQVQRMNDDTVLIYVAGSDAFWRIYSFDCIQNTITLTKEIEYPGYCILKIINLKWCDSEYIITLSTDGKITFWNKFSLKICHQKSVHQSGINSYDHVICSDNILGIVTGGDDATLVFSLFSYYQSQISFLNEWKNNTIYEAQISGVKIINNWILSAGADQKIVLWKWIKRNNVINAEVSAIHHSFIPDLHGFDVVQTSEKSIEMCVFGAGFEVFSLTLESESEEFIV